MIKIIYPILSINIIRRQLENKVTVPHKLMSRLQAWITVLWRLSRILSHLLLLRGLSLRTPNLCFTSHTDNYWAVIKCVTHNITPLSKLIFFDNYLGAILLEINRFLPDECRSDRLLVFISKCYIKFELIIIN